MFELTQEPDECFQFPYHPSDASAVHLVCDIQNSYLKKKHLSLGNISTSTLKNRCRQTHTQLNTGDLSQATISHEHPGETTPQYNGIRGGGLKNIFLPFGPQFGLQIKRRGEGTPGPSPGSATGISTIQIEVEGNM